jgi:hypothetical protein
MKKVYNHWQGLKPMNEVAPRTDQIGGDCENLPTSGIPNGVGKFTKEELLDEDLLSSGLESKQLVTTAIFFSNPVKPPLP